MDITLAPRATALALCFLSVGVLLGTASGLVPGLHANNMALLLGGIAPSVPGPPLYVGMAMLAAGVAHTFLEIIPTLALGVPDPAMAVAALPGHRLVLEGRGREALRLSTLGSGAAVLLAVPLAVPITRAMTTLWPAIRANLPLVLGGVAVLLVSLFGRLAEPGALVPLAGQERVCTKTVLPSARGYRNLRNWA